MEEEDLCRLEVGFMEAVRNKNLAHLEETLGEHFTLTTGRPGAEVRSRQEWLAVTRGEYNIESFEFEWIHADAYRDAAVVRSRYHQRATMAGQDRSTTYLMTSVWVRQGGWKLVTRHISPLGMGKSPDESCESDTQLENG